MSLVWVVSFGWCVSHRGSSLVAEGEGPRSCNGADLIVAVSTWVGNLEHHGMGRRDVALAGWIWVVGGAWPRGRGNTLTIRMAGVLICVRNGMTMDVPTVV